MLWHDAHQSALLSQCRKAQHAPAVALPPSVVQRMVGATHVLRRDLMQLGHAPLGDWRSLTRCADPAWVRVRVRVGIRVRVGVRVRDRVNLTLTNRIRNPDPNPKPKNCP